jgi:hypothetical protein
MPLKRAVFRVRCSGVQSSEVTRHSAERNRWKMDAGERLIRISSMFRAKRSSIFHRLPVLRRLTSGLCLFSLFHFPTSALDQDGSIGSENHIWVSLSCISAPTVPLWASTSPLTMARPIPAPPCSLERDFSPR